MLPAQTQIILLIVSSPAISAFGESMIGPGEWRVSSVEACEGEFPLRLDMSRHKVNRSHDGFDVRLDVDRDIDDTHAVRVDVCTYVDGGCKPYQTLADDSLPRFLDKYAGDNVPKFLSAAGLEPNTFPIPVGSWEVRDFVFNYEELPRDGIYGRYRAAAYVLRDAREVACVRLHAQFVEDDDE